MRQELLAKLAYTKRRIRELAAELIESRPGGAHILSPSGQRAWPLQELPDPSVYLCYEGPVRKHPTSVTEDGTVAQATKASWWESRQLPDSGPCLLVLEMILAALEEAQRSPVDKPPLTSRPNLGTAKPLTERQKQKLFKVNIEIRRLRFVYGEHADHPQLERLEAKARKIRGY